MGTALDTPHPIDSGKLIPRAYAWSLIQQALDCRLLDQQEAAHIQADLLSLLGEQCRQWSHGESSSVPIERAQEIMTSILFVIGVQLKACPTPEQAVDRLKAEPLRSLFEGGLKLVQRKVLAARYRHRRVTEHLLETPNVYYRSTILDGLNGFFKQYRPHLAAHAIHITADYPVLMGRPELDGIEMIEQYLRCIEAENAFCLRFAPEDIHHLLCGLTPDYQHVPLNLFEYVMLSALGLVLLHRSPRPLNLSSGDVKRLQACLAELPDGNVDARLEQAALALDRQGFLPASTRTYLSATLRKLAADIRHALHTGTLDKVFLVPAYPEREVKLTLDIGQTMDNQAYRKLLEALWQAESGEEKVSLILQGVHSPADLLDILSDAPLLEGELAQLVQALPFPMFVLLLSQYEEDAFLERESERLLFAALQRHRQRLTGQERQQAELVRKALQREEPQGPVSCPHA